MAPLLVGVPTLDPVTFGAVGLLLGGVAVGAAWVPAWRAASVSPVEALAAEQRAPTLPGPPRSPEAGQDSEVAFRTLPSLLAHGITTIRDPGGPADVLVRIREEVGDGYRTGPEMRVAGEVIDQGELGALGTTAAVNEQVGGRRTWCSWKVTQQAQYMARREAIIPVLYESILDRRDPDLALVYRPMAGIISDVASWEASLLDPYGQALESGLGAPWSFTR